MSRPNRLINAADLFIFTWKRIVKKREVFKGSKSLPLNVSSVINVRTNLKT